jgi:hypothetical protein
MIDELWKSLQELDSTANEEYRKRSQAKKSKGLHPLLEEKIKTKTKSNSIKKLKKKEKEVPIVSVENLKLFDDSAVSEENKVHEVLGLLLHLVIHSHVHFRRSRSQQKSTSRRLREI